MARLDRAGPAADVARTGIRGWLPWLVLLVGLTIIRLWIAALVPLAPDEAYYWVWSKALAAGYPDHPPMVALWIRAGTALLGDTELGVRLLGPLATAAGSVLLWRAAEDMWPGRRAGVTAAVLANATLLFGAGAVTMTPDTPLLFFWTCALAGLGRVLATGRPAWWLWWVGVAAGLALASKYTAVLLAPAVLVWLLAVPSLRPWLGRPAPWLAVLAALAVFAPVIWWNAGHDWVSFVRQGGRAGDWQPGRALQFVGELLGGQIGLATPLLAVLFGAGFALVCGLAWRPARERHPGATLLAALLAVPSVVFVQHALGDRVQANWPSLLYPQAAIAAAGLAGGWRRLRGPAVGLGLLLTGVVWVQAIWAPVRLAMPWDFTLLRLGGWASFAAEVTTTARDGQAGFVVADNYGIAAELAWHMPADIPVLAVDARWRWFALPDAAAFVAGRPGIFVRSERRAEAVTLADFVIVEQAGEIARQRFGMVAERLRLYRVVGEGAAEPLAFLPRRGDGLPAGRVPDGRVPDGRASGGRVPDDDDPDDDEPGNGVAGRAAPRGR